MAGFDMGENLRKVFLASVGAVAVTAEKSQQVVEEKGELTVEQGRALNSELTRKAKEAFDNAVGGASDAALRSKLEAMTPEERAAYAEKVAQMNADIAAEAEQVADEPEASEADEAEDAVEPDEAE